MTKPRKKTKRSSNAIPSWLTPTKAEGQTVIVTDFGYVCVKPSTAAWFARHYEGKRLKPATARRRAESALEAMAMFLAETSWRKGDEVKEV